ncbi:MAG: hypothetical protein HW413_1233 [Thermoleophilia bacterium]|nr:hypothetical protein [Thermoleophilia bacterium]
MARAGNGAAWGSLLTGLASIATLPLAIYMTRFSDEYDLLHAGFAIPVAAGLGLVSLALAQRARLQRSLTLGRDRRIGVASVGRVLGIAGLCMAAAGVVALGVYGLLEYVGSRE